MDSSLTPTRGYKIDWLTFTLPEELDQNFRILKLLGYQKEFFEDCSGRYFFNAGITLGNYVSVFYNDKSQKLDKYAVNKHCYVFSGVGCTDLDGHIRSDWLDLFKFLKKNECKVTRLDVALDDFEGKINFSTVEKKLSLKHFKSVKRSYNVVKEQTTEGIVKGETIYIGGRKKSGINGNYFARFYNKYAEYRSKHQLLPTQAQKSGIWQRYELQFNKIKAEQVVNEILKKKSIGLVYSGIMGSIITFLEPVKNKNRKNYRNKSNWKIAPWWQEFLQDAEKINLRHVEQDFNFGSVLSWLRIAVVPTWQTVSDIFSKYGYSLDEIVTSLEVEKSKKLKRLLSETEQMPESEFNQYLQSFVGDSHEDD